MERNDWKILSRWVLFSSVGVVSGLVTAGVVIYFILNISGSLRDQSIGIVFFLGFPLIGLIEGVFLGIFQYLVLKGIFPSIKVNKWILVTCLGLAIAWSLGFILFWTVQIFFGFLLEEILHKNNHEIFFYLFWIIITVFLGSILGGFQMIELKNHSRNTRYWFFANAFSWPLIIIFVLVSLLIYDASYHKILVCVYEILLFVFCIVTISFIQGLYLLKIKHK